MPKCYPIWVDFEPCQVLNLTKKNAAKEYPEKFILDDRGILHGKDGSTKLFDKKILISNFNKLNDLTNI